jgi:hypothetical protein
MTSPTSAMQTFGGGWCLENATIFLSAGSECFPEHSIPYFIYVRKFEEPVFLERGFLEVGCLRTRDGIRNSVCALIKQC